MESRVRRTTLTSRLATWRRRLSLALTRDTRTSITVITGKKMKKELRLKTESATKKARKTTVELKNYRMAKRTTTSLWFA